VKRDRDQPVAKALSTWKELTAPRPVTRRACRRAGCDLMQQEEASQDDEVYALLGRLVVAVSNLEHQLDLAILSINETHPTWLLEAARSPPMKVKEKAKIVAEFVAEHHPTLGAAIHADFVFLIGNIFDLRNALLHGKLRGWEQPVETEDAAAYVTRLLIENRRGKKQIGLTTAVVTFDVLRELTDRAWQFAQMIGQAVPAVRHHDVEMEDLLEKFRARRSAPNREERLQP
jgi:hypothetical protein